LPGSAVMLRTLIRRRLRTPLLPLLCACLAVATTAQTSPSTVRGFSSVHSRSELLLEQTFMAVPDAKDAEVTHQQLTVEPHIAGSPGDRRTAEYVLRKFRSYGLEADVEEFQAILSEPGKVKIDVLEPVKFSGPTPEFVEADPASRDHRTTVGFNAYAGSGDITGNVVYGNYGLPSDFQFLRSKGISVEGKVVIVRYGLCYRGVKAMMAEANKAAGMIVYSDPEDDGYHAGAAYPNGPWRPASGVQRGSVLYDFIYPDVLPDGSNRPHIPVMPLSYSDAKHILEHLGGPAAPREWQGGLPFTYRLGPGPAKVSMQVHLNSPRRTIWNVIAKIPGTEKPEEIVLMGNHRDAWAYGGVDPNSGTVALLEVARGLAVLLKQGWRPRRSIWLCSWDAEEQGEFGSSKWVEKHGAELTQKAVAYVNTDEAVSGDRFDASSTPSMKKFLKEVAADVPDPNGGSVLAHANDQMRRELREQLSPGHLPDGTDKPLEEQAIEIGDLGGGTDYAPFFDHLGIPSADFSFRGDYGVYHSIFDNHRWVEQFGDPKFLYHITAARYWGVLILRLAEADLLPFDYETYGQQIQSHLTGIRNKLVLLGKPGELDFRTAMDAAQRLANIGRTLMVAYETNLENETQVLDLHRTNRALVEAEEALLSPTGLPGRPWFKHLVFAPGFYSGYESVPLSGIHEMIDRGDFEEARRQLETLTVALDRASHILTIVNPP
jgi:N-acetylated-alpha-linked acidic dipeptidase